MQEKQVAATPRMLHRIFYKLHDGLRLEFRATPEAEVAWKTRE